MPTEHVRQGQPPGPACRGRCWGARASKHARRAASEWQRPRDSTTVNLPVKTCWGQKNALAAAGPACTGKALQGGLSVTPSHTLNMDQTGACIHGPAIKCEAGATRNMHCMTDSDGTVCVPWHEARGARWQASPVSVKLNSRNAWLHQAAAGFSAHTGLHMWVVPWPPRGAARAGKPTSHW